MGISDSLVNYLETRYMLCAFMAFVQFAAVPEESELKDPFRSERGSLKMMARAVKKRYFFVNKRCTFFHMVDLFSIKKSCCNCHFSNFEKSTTSPIL